MVPKPHCQSKFIDDPKQIAILLTNQVQCIDLLHCRIWRPLTNHFSLADPGATMTFVAGGALKPIGGHILSHASATRLYLRKGFQCRRATIFMISELLPQVVPKNA